MTGRRTTGSTRAAMALGFGLMLALSACALPPESRTPWVPHLKRMDEALARNDLPMAQRAAHDAFVTTRVTVTWEGNIAVGQAYQRLAERSEWRGEALKTARKAYFDAFLLARQQGSLDGVLESAAAFARVGDHAVADQCLFFARILADRAGGDAPQRVAASTERLAGSGSSAKMTEPFRPEPSMR